MTSIMQQRREAILSRAYQHGHVSVRDMAEALNVSEATIRRDLHGLANEGLLELTHGGASVSRSSDYSFLSKSMRNIDSKRIIAKLAAEYVKDGEMLFLDSGTTCFEMTSQLRSKKGLSVIVNSTRTAQELNVPGTNVLVLGGQYRPDRMDTIGPMANESLDRLRGYLCFLGTDGLSQDFGLTAIDIESAQIFGKAVQNARRTILLADSSKFDKPALYKIADFDSVSMVITDQKPSADWCSFFESKNIETVFPIENQ